MKKIITTSNLQKAFESYDAAKGTPVTYVDSLPEIGIRDIIYGLVTEELGEDNVDFYFGNSMKQTLTPLGKSIQPIVYVDSLPEDNIKDTIYGVEHSYVEHETVEKTPYDAIGSYMTLQSNGKYVVDRIYEVTVNGKAIGSAFVSGSKVSLYAGRDFTNLYAETLSVGETYTWDVDIDVDHKDFYIGDKESQTLTKIANVEQVEDFYIQKAEKGTAGGVATLDADGKVPMSQLSVAGDVPVNAGVAFPGVMNPNEDVTVGNLNVTLICDEKYGTYTPLDANLTNDKDIMLPEVTSVGRYHFVGWKDYDTGNIVSYIPAYCSEDRIYYAYFTQDKPVEGNDFKTVVEDGDDDTENGYLFGLTNKSEDLRSITTNYIENPKNNAWLFYATNIYPTTVTSTQYAQLYFPAIKSSEANDAKVYVEASEVVNVPIKFARAKPVIDTDYKVDNGIVSSLSSKIIETDSGKILDRNTTTLVGAKIRFAETFMYNASEYVETV